MKNRNSEILYRGLLLLCVFCLYGFSNVSMEEIETAIISQDYEQAKRIAAKLLSGDPNEDQIDEIQYYLALCDLKLGNYEQAHTAFIKLTKKKTDDKLRDKAYLGIFDSYYMDGHYRQAEKSINRLLTVSPRSEFLSLIYLKVARANLKLAHWDEARQYLKKITTNYPDSLEYYVAGQLLNEKQYFAVQIGAFMDRQRAQKLTEELQQKGEYAYIVETVDQKNRKFYRVRVGQIVLLDKAQQLKVKLSKDGYPTQIYP